MAGDTGRICQGRVLASRLPQIEPLPGDIEAGQSATGWLFVALDPAGVHEGDQLLLRFENVAVDNYRTVEDIDVRFDVGTSA